MGIGGAVVVVVVVGSVVVVGGSVVVLVDGAAVVVPFQRSFCKALFSNRVRLVIYLSKNAYGGLL